MKKILIISLILISTLSYADEYENDCYKYNSIEIYDCFEKVKTKIQNKIDKQLADIKKTKYNDSIIHITTKDIQTANFAFEIYVEKQCKLLDILSSGSKYQMEYCKIGMMRNRIKELDDMFKGIH